MDTVLFKLETPLTVGGKEITEVTLRKLTIGDEEDAMQQGVLIGKQLNPMTVDILTMSRVTGIPYDVMRKMPSREYIAMKTAHNRLNGLEPVPTQQAGTPQTD